MESTLSSHEYGDNAGSKLATCLLHSVQSHGLLASLRNVTFSITVDN